MYTSETTIKLTHREAETLKMRKFPYSVVEACKRGINIDKFLNFIDPIAYETREDTLKYITIAKQERDFIATLNTASKKPTVYTLTGQENDYFPAIAALFIVRAVFYNFKILSRAPLWHSIDSTYKDSLRDTPSDYAGVNCIVLSGIAENSSNVKFDKVRDIMEIYSHRTIILVAAGMNPKALMTQRVYKKPDKMLYFG